MELASEIQHGSREELIAYLKSWNFAHPDSRSDFELRLLVHKNFRKEGLGAGPASMATEKSLVVGSASV